MLLMNCEINVLLTQSDKRIIDTGDYGEQEPNLQ